MCTLLYVLVASLTLAFRSVLFVRSFQFQYVQRMQDHHPTRFMSSGVYMTTPFLFPDVSQHFYTNRQSHFDIRRPQRPSRQPARFGLALSDRLIRSRDLENLFRGLSCHSFTGIFGEYVAVWHSEVLFIMH